MPGLKRAAPTFLAFSGTWEGLGREDGRKGGGGGEGFSAILGRPGRVGGGWQHVRKQGGVKVKEYVPDTRWTCTLAKYFSSDLKPPDALRQICV